MMSECVFKTLTDHLIGSHYYYLLEKICCVKVRTDMGSSFSAVKKFLPKIVPKKQEEPSLPQVVLHQATPDDEKSANELVERIFKYIDCEFIPDELEKRIYARMLVLLMCSLRSVSKGLRVEFMNSVISIEITPKPSDTGTCS